MLSKNKTKTHFKSGDYEFLLATRFKFGQSVLKLNHLRDDRGDNSRS